MARTHMLRIEHSIWREYKKASADSDFSAGDLINWILVNLGKDDIVHWLKDLEFNNTNKRRGGG